MADDVWLNVLRCRADINDEDTTSSSRSHTAERDPVPAVLIPAENTIRHWNDLPQEVTEAKTIDTFSVPRASRLQ